MSIPLPTEEDLYLIREFILLPLILSAFERDKSAIDKSLIKTKKPYIDTIQRAMDRITEELSIIHKEFKKRGIKVFDGQRNEKGILYSYHCRGYKRDIEILWTYAKAEAEIRMLKYLS